MVKDLFLREILEEGEGVQGVGCTAPDESVTGESPEAVLRHIQDFIVAELVGADPVSPAELLAQIRSSDPPGPATVAGRRQHWLAGHAAITAKRGHARFASSVRGQ